MISAVLSTACNPVLPADQSGGGNAAPSTRSSGDVTAATKALAGLTVAKQHAMTGYSRDRFPHWNKTGKNCDVRDSVLQRDGKDVQLDGCNVVGGTWVSVYDGKTLTDPSQVDIDHMVPLADAWRSGADTWTDEKRSSFANDLDRPQLFAVSASSNRSKGDQDPAQWKPPSHDYWCQYAEDWVTVKAYWKLTVTADERDALAAMLATCA